LSIWQLPVALLLVGGWIFWGGRVLHKRMAAIASRKESARGRCTRAAVLSGLAGIVCAGIGIAMGKLLGDAIGVRWFYLGIPFAGLAFLGISFLTVFASFQLPAGQLSGIWLKAFGPVLLVTMVAEIPAFWVSYNDNQRQISLRESQEDLYAIYRGLNAPILVRTPPKTLEALLNVSKFQAGSLKCRRHPDRKIGYFFAPAELIDMREPTTKLLACDWADNQAGGERAILFINGRVDVADHGEFDSLLQDPSNADFKEALGAAEKELLGK